MKKIITTIASAALLCWATTAVAGPNLVVNGSFEQGAAGWDSKDFRFSNIEMARTGNVVAWTPCSGSICVDSLGLGSFVKQTLDTFVGAKYELTLWVVEDAATESSLSVFWNGSLVNLIPYPAPNSKYYNSQNIYTVDWVKYSFEGLIATSTKTSFEIHGRQDHTAMFFDDISVVQTHDADVPEPTSLALMGIGALALMRRRTRK